MTQCWRLQGQQVLLCALSGNSGGEKCYAMLCRGADLCRASKPCQVHVQGPFGALVLCCVAALTFAEPAGLSRCNLFPEAQLPQSLR